MWSYSTTYLSVDCEDKDSRPGADCLPVSRPMYFQDGNAALINSWSPWYDAPWDGNIQESLGAIGVTRLQ